MSNPDENNTELVPKALSDVETPPQDETLKPGHDTVPVPQDPNQSPFAQNSLLDGSGGNDHSGVVINSESISNFADRHRVPVTVVRELNPDKVDAYGNLLANVDRLVLP